MDDLSDITRSLQGLILWKRDDRGRGHNIRAVYATNSAAKSSVQLFLDENPDAPVCMISTPSYPIKPTKRVLLSEAMAMQLELPWIRHTAERMIEIARAIHRKGIEVIVLCDVENLVDSRGRTRSDEMIWVISMLKSYLETTRLMVLANTELGQAAIRFDDGVSTHFVGPTFHHLWRS